MIEQWRQWVTKDGPVTKLDPTNKYSTSDKLIPLSHLCWMIPNVAVVWLNLLIVGGSLRIPWFAYIIIFRTTVLWLRCSWCWLNPFVSSCCRFLWFGSTHWLWLVASLIHDSPWYLAVHVGVQTAMANVQQPLWALFSKSRLLSSSTDFFPAYVTMFSGPLPIS